MNITLEINDTICTNCYKNSIQNTFNFTSSTQSFELQDNYLINIISVETNRFIVIIQNGENVIIRNIIKNTPTSILLPSCSNHILTIASL